jgi:hypothetical protein
VKITHFAPKSSNENQKFRALPVMKLNSVQKKYVFIGGHPRSGTTLLAFNIGRMENCTAMENTGVSMDEGQMLQTVYPDDLECGGAGRFAFDPRAHLTETSTLLTPENKAKLRASWDAWWDASKAICIEKSTGNLLKGRFLQAVFENSCFIIIKRHPVATCLAIHKWNGSFTKPPTLFDLLSFSARQKWSGFPLHRLFEHWLRCYDTFAEDKKHLREVYELTYEDYIANQNRHHQNIAAFIGAGSPEDSEPATDSYNKKYMDQWHRMLTSGVGKKYCQFVAAKYETRFARHNYSLVSEFEDGDKLLRQGAAISPAMGAFYCACADAVSMVWGWTKTCKWFIKRKLGRTGDEILRFERQSEAKRT